VIYNRSGQPRGAICISVPETRFRAIDRARMAAAVRNACDAASASIR
jgi:DNA-binding IclR family transcriptional regulator